MAADLTISLLTSALGSSAARALFKAIVNSRIADKTALKRVDSNAEETLASLAEADLISPAPDGNKYFVTAKGLKVARDLERIPG